MYESGENSLETILILKNRTGQVRSIDIARELNFSKPSVSRAVSVLKESGYITMDRAGIIELTQAGKEKAEAIYERHTVLTAFLSLTAGVDSKKAEEDACKIEHIISAETFAGIKTYMDRAERM